MEAVLKVGYSVTVLDCGGNPIAHGKLEAFSDYDPMGECRMVLVDGQWYPEPQVNCSVCGSDNTCPQCGAVRDLDSLDDYR
jgi:hypothetical protein